MRIGMIMTDTDSYHDLACGLREHGHQVTILAKTSVEQIGDYQDIAAFMQAAQGFDLIHSCIGAAPVIFSPFIPTPMLCTLDDYLRSEEVDICRKAPARCYFAATHQRHVVEGIRHLFVLENGMDVVAMYLSAYELIRRENAREDQRPWGFYRVLSDQSDHKVKQITVWPGRRLSLQSHQRRAEHWIIISGLARVTVNNRHHDLCARDAVDIPLGAAHRIQNTGTGPLVFIEVQQGDYFGEDDITRLEDDFGRV
mgnify:CR=1 FL=1|jgi:mannose-6-phosphate isomerase-like protein (cupin superfamily)